RSSLPPEPWASPLGPPQQATQTVSRVAAPEMVPHSGPSSVLLSVTLVVLGSLPQGAPGPAPGTQTAPASTATPSGPEPVPPTGIVAVTLSVAGSMRLIWSLPPPQGAPAPAAMPEE